jgi:amidase
MNPDPETSAGPAARATALAMENIRRWNPVVNAMITVTAESAQQRAALLDRAEQAGEWCGLLHGVTINLKDNIDLAGVPTTAASSILKDNVPSRNAFVADRLLANGAVIMGKANLHEWVFGPTSQSKHFGPVRNPWNPRHIPGGSSGGSGASVASGMAVVSIGSDTAGSIRMPASFSGTYGLKPTYGLVPYSGVFEGEYTLDHVGPMAATVRDIALLLAAIAGPDGIDPRQLDVTVGDYVGALDQGVEGLRIGILDEGFLWPRAEPEVADAVRNAAEGLRALGAVVEDVSIPLHRDSPHIWRAIAAEGAHVRVLRGNGQGVGTKGYYHPPLIDAIGRARARNANDFSVTVKYVVLLGEYLHEHYGSHYYAKARTLSRTLAAAYDAALARHDVLVMPTTVMRATPLPGPDASLEEKIQRAFEVNDSTCGFDVTGHPAMSIPCARIDGLPVGLMAVGPAFGEALVLRVARACEVTCSA